MTDLKAETGSLPALLKELKRYRPELTNFYPLPSGVWTQMVSADGQSSIRAADDQWIRVSELEAALSSVSSEPPQQQESERDACKACGHYRLTHDAVECTGWMPAPPFSSGTCSCKGFVSRTASLGDPSPSPATAQESDMKNKDDAVSRIPEPNAQDVRNTRKSRWR